MLKSSSASLLQRFHVDPGISVLTCGNSRIHMGHWWASVSWNMFRFWWLKISAVVVQPSPTNFVSVWLAVLTAQRFLKLWSWQQWWHHPRRLRTQRWNLNQSRTLTSYFNNTSVSDWGKMKQKWNHFKLQMVLVVNQRKTTMKSKCFNTSYNKRLKTDQTQWESFFKTTWIFKT